MLQPRKLPNTVRAFRLLQLLLLLPARQHYTCLPLAQPPRQAQSSAHGYDLPIPAKSNQQTTIQWKLNIVFTSGYLFMCLPKELKCIKFDMYS